MTTIDIDAIRQREQAATKGPWTTGADEAWSDVFPRWALVINANHPLIEMQTGAQGVADAEFIAHARTDVPALLAKVDELTAELVEEQASHQATLRNQSALSAGVQKLRAELETANRRNDGLQNDLDSATKANTAWANQTGAAAKVVDALRDYILNAIKGDGLDAAEMHDIASDLASVLGHLGHPVANEDGCDCESYDCKGQCCGVGNCTCTPTRPIVTVELPAEAVAR